MIQIFTKYTNCARDGFFFFFLMKDMFPFRIWSVLSWFLKLNLNVKDLVKFQTELSRFQQSQWNIWLTWYGKNSNHLGCGTYKSTNESNSDRLGSSTVDVFKMWFLSRRLSFTTVMKTTTTSPAPTLSSCRRRSIASRSIYPHQSFFYFYGFLFLFNFFLFFLFGFFIFILFYFFLTFPFQCICFGIKSSVITHFQQVQNWNSIICIFFQRFVIEIYGWFFFF